MGIYGCPEKLMCGHALIVNLHIGMNQKSPMKINNIFKSISGEVNGLMQGRLTTFVRLQGCNLNCSYCDTPESINRLHAPINISIIEIADRIRTIPCFSHVCFTGGEPLLQLNALKELIAVLYTLGFNISVETNGSINPFGLTGRWQTVDSWVVDYKLKSSGYYNHMDEHIHIHLIETDFVKFVIGDHEDLELAMRIQKDLVARGCKANFAYSPMHHKFSPKELFNNLVANGIEDAIINVQMHKYLDME